MTVHSAKGLEFKNVFVVGLEENLFPSGMVGDSPRALEEERRLFYVAITRAEEHCYLSFAKTRFRYGKMEFGSPSRFLRDIDVDYLRLPHEAGVSRAVDEGAGRFRREIEGALPVLLLRRVRLSVVTLPSSVNVRKRRLLLPVYREI